jgi:serine/threonine-protein kinase RIO1
LTFLTSLSVVGQTIRNPRPTGNQDRHLVADLVGATDRILTRLPRLANARREHAKAQKRLVS